MAYDRPEPGDLLTPGQYRIALLATRGLPRADIADVLDLSIDTIKTQLRLAYRKLDVRNRVELAARFAADPPTKVQWNGRVIGVEDVEMPGVMEVDGG